MSWQGGSLYVTRATVPAGTHAHVFRATHRGKDHPHITTSKPFDRECKAWCVVFTGTTNQHYIREGGRIRQGHTTAFRSEAHARAWFRTLTQ